MPQSVLLFYTRRPDLTPAEFEQYMIERHVPILKEAMGLHFPLSFNVQFVVRVNSGAGDRLGATTSSTKRAKPDDPVVLVGSPEDLGWDAMVELKFRDELHIQQALATVNGPEGQVIKEDEEAFTISEEMRVVLAGPRRSV